MLLCEHINELHKSELEPQPLGPPLDPGRMREVERALRFYLDLDRPEPPSGR